MSTEIEYELTAKHSDGLVFNSAMHDPGYPPGSNAVHQWRLLVDVPVEHLMALGATERSPHMHG